MSLSQHAAKLRRLTVRQAETNGDSRLYVINQANPRGNINVTITGTGGEKHTLQIPVTFIPVDMSNQAEKEPILRNPNFRRIHAKGHIVIVDGDDAEEFLKRPEVAREYARVYGEHAALPNAGGDVIIDGSQNGPTLGEQATVEDRALADGISPFIVNMIGRAESGEAPADLIADLDAQLTSLDLASVRFLADNTTVPQIKEWAVEAAGLLS